jgi:hypothetical protein
MGVPHRLTSDSVIKGSISAYRRPTWSLMASSRRSSRRGGVKRRADVTEDTERKRPPAALVTSRSPGAASPDRRPEPLPPAAAVSSPFSRNEERSRAVRASGVRRLGVCRADDPKIRRVPSGRRLPASPFSLLGVPPLEVPVDELRTWRVATEAPIPGAGGVGVRRDATSWKELFPAGRCLTSAPRTEKRPSAQPRSARRGAVMPQVEDPFPPQPPFPPDPPPIPEPEPVPPVPDPPIPSIDPGSSRGLLTA